MSSHTSGTAERWWCHACGAEVPIVRAPEPTCSVCRETFVEEIEADSNDDPRDFDVPDGPGADANDGPFGFGGGGGGAGGGAPMFRFVTHGQDGGQRVFEFGGAAEGAGGGGLLGLMRAFGLAVGAAQARPQPPRSGEVAAAATGRATAARRDREPYNDPGDPDDDALPGGGERGAQRGPDGGAQGQVPLRNLATFLGEAFGPSPAHPADDPRNNPFAEGGHDEDGAERDDQRRAQGQGQGQGQEGLDGVPGEASPFDYFITLLNAFGGGGVVPLASNPQDYAWGEESFQNLLNDLMAQASGRAGPQPAPKEMIDKLPRVSVTQAMLGDSASHVQDCSICQDLAKVGERFLVLPCKHTFHDECLVKWLEQSGTCPTCRFQLVPQPVNGIVPEQGEGREGEEGAGAGGGTAIGGRANDDAARSSEDSSGGSGSEGGAGAIPGSWPDAERSRSASRAASRARAEQEDRSPLIEDID